jgi:hypothetical protein
LNSLIFSHSRSAGPLLSPFSFFLSLVVLVGAACCLLCVIYEPAFSSSWTVVFSSLFSYYFILFLFHFSCFPCRRLPASHTLPCKVVVQSPFHISPHPPLPPTSNTTHKSFFLCTTTTAISRSRALISTFMIHGTIMSYFLTLYDFSRPLCTARRRM